MSSKPFLLLPLLAAALCASAWSQSFTVQLKQNAAGVSYLTDSNGLTLYYYTLDTNGQSACYGKCADAWPVFNTGNISVPAPLDPKDFGSITRTDGTQQTTYKGWPLYEWFKDKQPGDATGEGVGGVWFIVPVPFYSVTLATTKELGNYLADAQGRTLYYFTKDSAGQSVCTGNCLKNWPSFQASSLIVPSTLKASDFGTLTRPDGTSQVTFRGYPLYYCTRDQARGDVKGQGIGSIWYVVNPAKFSPGQTGSG